MSDLFNSLSVAARSLEAQRFGLDVTGQNIANVHTPGYSRRVAEFSAVAPIGPLDAGGGVDVTGIHAARDRFLERRLQQEVPGEQREAAIAGALGLLEVALGRPGQSIDARLSAFFDAFAQLADSPQSLVARQEALLQAESLAGAFRDLAGAFESARRDADAGVRAAVDEVNTLTARMAALNRSIGDSPHASATLHLRDEQAVLVRRLSELADVSVIAREEGGVDVSVAQGRPLVIGLHSYALDVSSVPPAGLGDLSIGGVPVTTGLAGGRLGGLLHVRDTLVPGYMAQLDELAHGMAEQVNAIHAAGTGLDGGTGRDLFVVAGVAGAAAALRVDGAIAADVRLIAAGASALPGDNATARALAALREAPVLGDGATMAETWGQLVYRVGRDTRAALDDQATRRAVVAQVEALRDQVSGISLDEEAMHLLKFQRAYEASARFFTTVDRALDTLMHMVAR